LYVVPTWIWSMFHYFHNGWWTPLSKLKSYLLLNQIIAILSILVTGVSYLRLGSVCKYPFVWSFSLIFLHQISNGVGLPKKHSRYKSMPYYFHIIHQLIKTSICCSVVSHFVLCTGYSQQHIVSLLCNISDFLVILSQFLLLLPNFSILMHLNWAAMEVFSIEKLGTSFIQCAT